MILLVRSITVLVALSTVSFSQIAFAQDWGPRSLEELKSEILHRSREEGWRGVKYEDAERAVSELNSLDRDHWAAIWSGIGDDYMSSARMLESSSPEKARDDYLSAFRAYNTGRWPTEKHSPGKRQAYEDGLQAFASYSRLLDPAIETLRIPFEDSEIVAYLRLPAGVERAPLVLSINGLDSRKEDVMINTDGYIDNGVAVFGMDMPGTGQAPVLIDVGSELIFSAALDYLATRPEIDASRIAVQSRSWSGYWAAVLAYTERDRIRGAVVHGVGVHHYFQPEWQETAILSPEYLFDLFPARSVVYGVDNMEDFLAYGPRMSLIERGLIDQPSAPMLLINGEKDTQQPIADLYLMMKRGDPKQAWVNPDGGHMGDTAEYPGSWIRANVIQPWIFHQLGVSPKAANH
jgi:pimeloyl-ACP methyl ester carboxylesterase